MRRGHSPGIRGGGSTPRAHPAATYTGGALARYTWRPADPFTCSRPAHVNPSKYSLLRSRTIDRGSSPRCGTVEGHHVEPTRSPDGPAVRRTTRSRSARRMKRDEKDETSKSCPTSAAKDLGRSAIRHRQRGSMKIDRYSQVCNSSGVEGRSRPTRDRLDALVACSGGNVKGAEDPRDGDHRGHEQSWRGSTPEPSAYLDFAGTRLCIAIRTMILPTGGAGQRARIVAIRIRPPVRRDRNKRRRYARPRDGAADCGAFS